MVMGVLNSTSTLLGASKGKDMVLNSVAIIFLIDIDEQLLGLALPPLTRDAIVREFREARNAGGGTRLWKWWKWSGVSRGAARVAGLVFFSVVVFVAVGTAVSAAANERERLTAAASGE